MTIAHGLTDDELNALSPAERAAITAEPSEDEASLAAGTAPGVADDGEPAADPLKGEPKTEIVTDPTDPEDEGAPAAESPDTPRDREPIAVAFSAEQVDMEKVNAAFATLQKKFDDGEITMDQMLVQRDQINFRVTEARLAAKHGAQVEETLWTRTVDDFLDRNPIYRTDPVLNDALDATIKRLAADESNKNLSDRKLIEKAHEQIAERFKAVEQAPPVDPKKALEAKRKPDLSKVPVTLAGVPAASPQSADADEFADVDRLLASGDSAAAERAIARMSQEQQDRYARAG